MSELFAPLPPGPFEVIYADPAWRFATWSDKGRGRCADRHYPTLTDDQIKSLPVLGITCAHAVCFLWTSAPYLVRSLAVLQAWGFSYRSHYAWAKNKMGPGYWNRGQHELLLIGVRGKPRCPVPSLRQSSLIVAPVGRHSEKPEAVAELIGRQYPQERKLELFARRTRAGWTSWGNEVEA